jgi:hypothetical protein
MVATSVQLIRQWFRGSLNMDALGADYREWLADQNGRELP